MIDISKMQLGDKVTVHGTILTIDRRRDRFGGAGIAIREQWFTPEKIITHTPAPHEFKPGDRVTWGDGLDVYEFIAQRGAVAIVWDADYGIQGPSLSDLRHADESE